MLFNPDAGLNIDEMILRKWNTEWDLELKAEILQLAERMGCTWFDVVLECVARFCDDWENSIQRQCMEAWRDRRDFPCGKDPLLNRALEDQAQRILKSRRSVEPADGHSHREAAIEQDWPR